MVYLPFSNYDAPSFIVPGAMTKDNFIFLPKISEKERKTLCKRATGV